jgi:DNA-binding response OmpR family regulator
VASQKTILVLDDDPSVRHMLRVLIEQQGHAVVTVGDARSALAQCSVQLPDLMIVDLMLPIEDGEMFLREFRRRWRHAQIPVIVLSASTARNDIARRVGADATLAKPFFAEDLRELVALHVRSGERVVAG